MKIDIIGTGNVGTHLFNALSGQANVNSVPARTLDGLRTDADIYLISVSDDAIRDVASSVVASTGSDGIIAHTSGTTPLSRISDLGVRAGVFYPMQTFSKDVKLDYAEIPFFIEGMDADVTARLKETAELISVHVSEADSEARCNLHIASVLSCNLVNHLWTLAYDFLDSKGLSFESMLPLINETVRKVSRVTPPEAQTGPAIRQDMKIIGNHIDCLKENEDIGTLYKLLSESIIKRHHKYDRSE